MDFIKEIDLEKCVITLYDNQIVKLKFKDNVDFILQDAIDTNQIIYNLVNGERYLSLVDTINVRGQISTEAMNYFAKDKLMLGVRLAEGIVINSLHNRILANFYLKFSKSHNPVKIFSKMDSAIKWLLEEFKKQN